MTELRDLLAARHDSLMGFLRDIVSIPSYDSNIRDVARRVESELRLLGFEDVHYAPYGDLVARIGDGKRKLIYDSHLDTVGVGDPKEWKYDPFGGVIQDGMMYGRGVVDEKGSTPPMIYGLKAAHDLGLLAGITAYYFGSIEEWCEGLSAQVFVETEGIRPDYVVIGEPTNLGVVRGQKGRVEFRVTAHGRSAHGASHWLGENALYDMLPFLQAIPRLDEQLPDDPFMGRGSIVATYIDVTAGSYNVVPDRCSVVLDRRLTRGETADQALAQVHELLPTRDFDVQIMTYDRPSYNGYVREHRQVFPAWSFAESHPLIQAAIETSHQMGLGTSTGKWNFSTNGAYWAGTAGIPSVGFGPGEEAVVHTVDEHIRVQDVIQAAEWYARLPGLLS